jgi:hypothetical protein
MGSNSLAHNLYFDSKSLYQDIFKHYQFIAFSNQYFVIREFIMWSEFEKKLYTKIVYNDNYPLKKDIVYKIDWEQVNES